MRHNKITFKVVGLFVAVSFFTQIILPSFSFSQELLLPKPQEFVNLSSAYSFPVLKGMKFSPTDPLKMEFIIDIADQKEVTEKEVSRLIRYFLCGLTIPEEDIWVNLSSYEEDRITSPKLAETDLGRDLLAQDYLLKQLSSSLVYPESETGKDYWGKVYKEVQRIAKTTKVPVDTFNKIWIAPDEAEVYEDQAQGLCLITKASLKVMLEEDFLALSNQNTQSSKDIPFLQQEIHKTASQVMRQTILPKIAEDVNKGKNFSNLRQIYHSLILACWFKKKFKESIYKYYIDQGKIKGIDLRDKSIKEKIYNTYLEAFSKGLYNYIKTESEPVTKKRIKRRYFSGGMQIAPKGVKTTYVLSSFSSVASSLLSTIEIDIIIPRIGKSSSSLIVQEKDLSQRIGEFKRLLPRIGTIKAKWGLFGRVVDLDIESLEENKQDFAKGILLINRIIREAWGENFGLENGKFDGKYLWQIKRLSLSDEERLIFMEAGKHLGFWGVGESALTNINFPKIMQTAIAKEFKEFSIKFIDIAPNKTIQITGTPTETERFIGALLEEINEQRLWHGEKKPGISVEELDALCSDEPTGKEVTFKTSLANFVIKQNPKSNNGYSNIVILILFEGCPLSDLERRFRLSDNLISRILSRLTSILSGLTSEGRDVYGLFSREELEKVWYFRNILGLEEIINEYIQNASEKLQLPFDIANDAEKIKDHLKSLTLEDEIIKKIINEFLSLDRRGDVIFKKDDVLPVAELLLEEIDPNNRMIKHYLLSRNIEELSKKEVITLFMKHNILSKIIKIVSPITVKEVKSFSIEGIINNIIGGRNELCVVQQKGDNLSIIEINPQNLIPFQNWDLFSNINKMTLPPSIAMGPEGNIYYVLYDSNLSSKNSPIYGLNPKRRTFELCGYASLCRIARIIGVGKDEISTQEGLEEIVIYKIETDENTGEQKIHWEKKFNVLDVEQVSLSNYENLPYSLRSFFLELKLKELFRILRKEELRDYLSSDISFEMAEDLIRGEMTKFAYNPKEKTAVVITEDREDKKNRLFFIQYDEDLKLKKIDILNLKTGNDNIIDISDVTALTLDKKNNLIVAYKTEADTSTIGVFDLSNSLLTLEEAKEIIESTPYGSAETYQATIHFEPVEAFPSGSIGEPSLNRRKRKITIKIAKNSSNLNGLELIRLVLKKMENISPLPVGSRDKFVKEISAKVEKKLGYPLQFEPSTLLMRLKRMSLEELKELFKTAIKLAKNKQGEFDKKIKKGFAIEDASEKWLYDNLKEIIKQLSARLDDITKKKGLPKNIIKDEYGFKFKRWVARYLNLSDSIIKYLLKAEKVAFSSILNLPKKNMSSGSSIEYGGIAFNDGINVNVAEGSSPVDLGDLKIWEEIWENSKGLNFRITEIKSTTLNNFLGIPPVEPHRIP